MSSTDIENELITGLDSYDPCDRETDKQVVVNLKNQCIGLAPSSTEVENYTDQLYHHELN